MPALDMHCGMQVPTYFEMLGFSEYGMTDSDLPTLENRRRTITADLGTSEPATALLEQAVATLTSAESRHSYRVALGHYRQDTVSIVRNFYAEHLSRYRSLLAQKEQGQASSKLKEAASEVIHTYVTCLLCLLVTSAVLRF